MTRILAIAVMCCVLLGACQPAPLALTQTPARTPSATMMPPAATVVPTPTPTPTLLSPTVTPLPPVPDFSHVTIFVLENKEFGTVIGKTGMPNYNAWAQQYTLLIQYYAIRKPSLPNYLALIGGDTFEITTNCEDCNIDAPSLPDLIEASGRTWKTYQEDMPEPCFQRSTLSYVKKHNPFMYFDSIRLNQERCQRSVVPLGQMTADLQNDAYPDFAFVVPNLWNSAHDGPIEDADAWLGKWVSLLMNSPAYDDRSLIVLTWDEGQGEHTCCGLTTGGGRVATVLISPLVKNNFQDDTPYTHYALLRTIASAWGLSYLGHAADEQQVLIEAPWIVER